MEDPLTQLQHIIEEERAHALWISSLPSIRWACGFTGSNGVLLVLPDVAYFVSDGRYALQAKREVKGAQVHTPGYDLAGYIAEKGLLPDGASVIFEADHVSVAAQEELTETFSTVEWRPEKELLTRCVAVKRPDEIAKIRTAQQVTEDVYAFVVDWLAPGQTEKEVAAEIVYQHLRRGADGMSFDVIVASGPNSALPHARPTSRRLEHGDIVLLDFGCFVDGYASDMTRTVFLGEADPEACRVYELVLSAQRQAIASAKAGIVSKELDAVARDVLKEGGYGEHFSHGLGHGVGLQIHEWPRVSYRVDDILPADCVVSVEPGVYVPDRFGIRIEDLIVLREHGCEVLTAAPKELTIL